MPISIQHCSRQAGKTLPMTSGVEYAQNLPAARKTNANDDISYLVISTRLLLHWITPSTISKAKYVNLLYQPILLLTDSVSDLAAELPTAECKVKPRRRNGIPVQHGYGLRDDAERSDQPVVPEDQCPHLPVHERHFGYFVQQPPASRWICLCLLQLDGRTHPDPGGQCLHCHDKPVRDGNG